MTKTLVRVLSAGSVEPGLVAAVEAYSRLQGCEVRIDWATTPNIRRRLSQGEAFDLVVLTAEAARDLTLSGQLAPEPHPCIGSVGVGFAVRAGASLPAIESPVALMQALRAADSIIFTRATSGLAVEAMLRREGVYDELFVNILRFETGPQMMSHLIESAGNVACLGAAVELRMFDGKGIRYAGLIPESLQKRTAYVAAPTSVAACPGEARALAQFLASSAGRRFLGQCGVDVPVG